MIFQCHRSCQSIYCISLWVPCPSSRCPTPYSDPIFLSTQLPRHNTQHSFVFPWCCSPMPAMPLSGSACSERGNTMRCSQKSISSCFGSMRANELVKDRETEGRWGKEMGREREREVESEKVRKWERALCGILSYLGVHHRLDDSNESSTCAGLTEQNYTELSELCSNLIDQPFEVLPGSTWTHAWSGWVAFQNIPLLTFVRRACQGCPPWRMMKNCNDSRSQPQKPIISWSADHTRCSDLWPWPWLLQMEWDFQIRNHWLDGGFELCAGRPLPGPATSWQRCKTKVSI